MTAEAREFFNNIDKTAPAGVEKLLPQETIDRIFDDMVKARPLLQHIGLRNAGIRLKSLKSTQTGQAVWGKINGEIQGPLETSLQRRRSDPKQIDCICSHSKVSSEKFGPAWLQSFVSAQITEAFAAALGCILEW